MLISGMQQQFQAKEFDKAQAQRNYFASPIKVVVPPLQLHSP